MLIYLDVVLLPFSVLLCLLMTVASAKSMMKSLVLPIFGEAWWHSK